MANNNSQILQSMQLLDLEEDESYILLELVKGPNTHLRLSRATGINRSKVYRLVEQLEQRGLVRRRSDDRGTFLIAADLNILENELFLKEEALQQQRVALQSLQPILKQFVANQEGLAIHTYSGIEGFKQMLWNELRAKGELLALGNILLETLIDNRRIAERLRAMAADMGYSIREIINAPYKEPNFSDVALYMSRYSNRHVSKQDLPIDTQMTIYNDTVAVYDMSNGKRTGLEIVSPLFANTMRHIFEHYWEVGDKGKGESKN